MPWKKKEPKLNSTCRTNFKTFHAQISQSWIKEFCKVEDLKSLILMKIIK